MGERASYRELLHAKYVRKVTKLWVKEAKRQRGPVIRVAVGSRDLVSVMEELGARTSDITSSQLAGSTVGSTYHLEVDRTTIEALTG